ncbi:MAG: DNA-3-methyladenine glycosylase [Anaerolineae bacterium]
MTNQVKVNSVDNPSESRLPASFFGSNARIVAQRLLGKSLVHKHKSKRLVGRIVEVEAYCDFREADLACHGSRNKGRPTKRTQIMFGEGGYSYVYLNYGIHWLFNIVTGEIGTPSAVLIRALEPVEGHMSMAVNRNHRPKIEWTNGPGKLSMALSINQSHNGQNLCRPDSVIWVENQTELDPSLIACGPRIGLGKTPEPWHSMPWRYWIKGNQFVSANSKGTGR